MSARKRLIVAIPATLATIVLVYLALDTYWAFWILAAFFALGAFIWWAIWYGEFSASRWSGDDLIDLEVADEGIVVQGGLAIPWSQVAGAGYTWQRQQAVSGRGIGAKVGAATATAAVGAAGFDGVIRAMDFSVRDAAELRANATGKPQRDAVLPPGKDGLGRVHIGLSGVQSAEEMEQLVALVGSLCEANQIAFAKMG